MQKEIHGEHRVKIFKKKLYWMVLPQFRLTPDKKEELSLISRMRLTLSFHSFHLIPDRHPLTFTHRVTARALVSQQVISEKS